MIKLLIKRFIPSAENSSDPVLRQQYCMLSGILGMVCNLVLFAIKLSAGLIMGSIAVQSDAFNNLSDLGTSAVTLVGAKMSSRSPDKEHPFGHGRIEYITALIISFVILFMGFELGKNSLSKLFSPEKVVFSLPILLLLCLSVAIKLWMFSYNRYLGRISGSDVIRAASADSISDVYATLAVILSTVLGHFISFPFDAVAGILVSALILYNGFCLAKDTISTLLGRPPEPELVQQLKTLLMQAENVVGIHDLIVHDYGPGRVFASVHAEVPDTVDIVRKHEIIDEAETRIQEQTGITIVIHMDPISTQCEKTNRIHKAAEEILSSINPACSLHDFRITDGENQINVLFDLAVPAQFKPHQKQAICDELTKKLQQMDSRYQIKIHMDDLFI